MRNCCQRGLTEADAALAVIAQIDLIQAVDFDRAAAIGAIERARPGIEICELSAKTGEGFGDWASRLATPGPAKAGHYVHRLHWV